jgi:UV DNA damage endonuclease
VIKIGYVGINTELPTASRTFKLANYSESRMLEVARSNILALEAILKWNCLQKIALFRITSKLIPFGSSPINSGSWKTVYRTDFQRIGHFIRDNGMRVSMHPGQYAVLNTPVEVYLNNTLRDLEYHNDIINLMELDASHRIVIHGGGAYGEKEKSLTILSSRINSLKDTIHKRIVLENDEKVFTAEDILKICYQTKVPGVLDIFHHEILPSFSLMSLREIILIFQKTWSGERQKIHYSNQQTGKFKGSHSQTINIDDFVPFYNSIKDLELDVMLEVKDKQASVLKLRQAFPELR